VLAHADPFDRTPGVGVVARKWRERGVGVVKK
jgi:hypothetical protein